MSKFIKHNGSLINLNLTQEITIEAFEENYKTRYSVVMIKSDGRKHSLGVFNDRDKAQEVFDYVEANIDYIELPSI